eukprot:gene3577-3498_t
MENGRGLQLLADRMLATAAKAEGSWGPEAAALRDALQQVGQATQQAWDGAQPAQALANAVPYLQAFGHTVIAWIWLDVAASLGQDDTPAAQGRRAACRYFYRYELPKIGAWLNVVSSRDPTCFLMIRHIVMWNLHEQAEGADKAANLEKAKALLLSCAQVVPGIRAFEVATATP